MVTVTNSGTSATSGSLTVSDVVPAGLTATAIGGAGWSCTLATVTCIRNDTLIAGGSFSLAVTVTIANNAPGSVTNQVSASGGGAMPAAATDIVTILPYSPCDLTQDGIIDAADVRRIITDVLSAASPQEDLNQDTAVNVVDIQVLINAALSQVCVGA